MASLADLASEQPEDWDPNDPPEQSRQGVPLADLGQVHTFGELKNHTFAPSETVGHLLQDGLMALGANRHSAGHFGPAFRDLAQFTPLGIPMGLADFVHYGREGEFGNAALAAMSVIPPIGMVGKGLRVSRGSRLPMDEASRMARAREMGLSDQSFYRGEASGKLPTEYTRGAHFSRDKQYADGFAQQGGLPESREFRLDLRNAYRDSEPLTAAAYSRLVDAAAASNPKLAADMVASIAPGKDAAWLAGFAQHRPDMLVTDAAGTAMLRHAIEKNTADSIDVFKRAGFNALDSGRDVRKLDGFGIRSTGAKFDPAKSQSPNILASMVGGAIAPNLFSESENYPSRE